MRSPPPLKNIPLAFVMFLFPANVDYCTEIRGREMATQREEYSGADSPQSYSTWNRDVNIQTTTTCDPPPSYNQSQFTAFNELDSNTHFLDPFGFASGPGLYQSVVGSQPTSVHQRSTATVTEERPTVS